jgi:lantibiotic modifying enzyme
MWEAIVTKDELKNEILLKLDEIALDLSINYPALENIGLMDGKAGVSLFFNYLNKLKNSDAHEPEVSGLLGDVISTLNSTLFLSTYCSGISGILWCLDHLSSEGFIELDAAGEDVIEFLEQQSLGLAKDSNFDFLHGANGIALYLLSKSSTGNTESLSKVIDLLHEKGIIENDTIKWESVINHDTHKKGFNLSLSHGISNIIILLSNLLEKDPGNERAADLLDKAINYLLSQKNRPPVDSLYIFPSYIGLDNARIESRLAWCYGDMGNALALYKAGTILKRAELTDEAVSILLHSVNIRKREDAGIKDAGICHGTAGIAHMYNRFYQLTGRPEFKEAATYWLEETMRMATFKDGFAGYKAFQGQEDWKSEMSLLDGISGIGLVLMSAISEMEPKWDRCLLLS